MRKDLKPEVKLNEKYKSALVTTAAFRASYPNIAKPGKAMEEDQEGKYGVDALFPKNRDFKWMRKAVEQVADMTWGKGKRPKGWRNPIKDGDELYDEAVEAGEGKEENLENLKGHYVIKMSSKNKPKASDAEGQVILEENAIYGGCWCRAKVTIKAYKVKGNKGIAVYINGIQFVADDEKFGGGQDASFDDVSSDDEDIDSDDIDTDEDDADDEFEGDW